MRRGHPGIGGWRGENTRHFRPRSGGTPHFRPPRNFGLLDTPRFAPPSRFKEILPLITRPELNYSPSEHHDRNKYRHNNQSSNQRHDRDFQSQRGNYAHSQRRHGDGSNYSQYQEPRNYHNIIQSEPYLNSMGDVDHRQLMTTTKTREPYSHHRTPVWSQNEDKRRYQNEDRYAERNQNKSYRPDITDSGKLPTSDYIGHRPPASDHYGGNPGSGIDDSNSFSRSVDDTVDLVRKRLLSRNEPQPHCETELNNHSLEHQESSVQDPGIYQTTREPPAKKRVQRHKQHVQNNCDKMKNKIVHQLFKMDKAKIHKLMDNPNSSNKFEYAISSLITESQNSLNRHLRSVAEKSLTTSSDFINNDNNTIYEDTFMKQMQCILDPQDTVFLEDIKPLVMEELSKVLQLDNYYEQPHDNTGGRSDCYAVDQYGNNTDNADIYNEYPYEQNDPQNYELLNPEINTKTEYQVDAQPTEQLFHRRPPSVQRNKSQERRVSMEQRRLSRLSAERKSNENPYSLPDMPLREQQHRRSIDRKSYEEPAQSEPLPIFDSNADQFSEEEDPFADLDKQYHVAVDHNFIQSYDASPQPSVTSSRSKSPPATTNDIEIPSQHSNDIKKEIDNQLLNIAQSPLEIIPSIKEVASITPKKEFQVKHELNITPEKNTENSVQIKKECGVTPAIKINDDKPLDNKDDQESSQKNLDQKVENSENDNNSTIIKKSSSSSSRKRSLDQRPSHRKEKRKKSEPNQSELNKQILNKNIIINVNDCAAKKNNNEKCAEAAKSIFNLFFSKDEHSKMSEKDTNKGESTDKGYSDKYVKRKEQSSASREIKREGTKKRHHSTSSSHSIVSPKTHNTSNNSSSQPHKSDKSDHKSKLKHIDMFSEQARKVSMHQSNRNTALPPKTPDKLPDENKTALPVIRVKKNMLNTNKLISKETQTFESKKSTSRFSQTEKKKMSVKATQTDPVLSEKPGPKSTDAFERMKEIDLEIQVLLQEKFKLYSSLESKDTTQSLGMTVLNVAPYVEDKEQDANLSESEDVIVANFTSIPVEELEQIAFETVDDDAFESPKGKKNHRQKVTARERTNPRSPLLQKNKKRKEPNISLIEQIITDDRPLEDIISLDDLESSPMKPKKKSLKQISKSKKKSSKKRKFNFMKNKPVKETIITPEGLHLKECCVLLHRDEIENYLNNKGINSESVLEKVVEEPAVIVETVPLFADTEINSMYTAPEREETIQETVNVDSVNDIHFDMLDVSEDIVIGDAYDGKHNEKDVSERVDISVSEEIILDNSQSSIEETAMAQPTHTDVQCKMYDFSTDETLRRDAYTVTSNPDAVLALECVDNSFLAACLDGNVYHYSGDGQLLATLRGYNQPVTCLNIVRDKYETIVYTGSLDSRIRYYDLETGMEKGPECNVLSPIQSMDRAWDTVFVGTRTGFVLQFECKNNMLIPVSTVKFSEQSILALRAMKEGPRKVLLVAARSEDVTVKDAQTGLLLRTLSGPKMTVYSLLYEDGKVFCGTSSHQIHVFDYATSSHVATHEGGKGVVCLRASGGLLFAGCYDGCVYVYRESEPRPLAQLRGPGIMLLSLAIVGSKIIAGYKDRGLHIWKIPLTILQEMIL